MLEAALIAIFEQQDIGWCVLVNSEVGDRGGTGCPRDDEPWYYVYIVSIDCIGKQRKQYQLRAGASSKLTDSTNLQTARPNLQTALKKFCKETHCGGKLSTLRAQC